jgi:hypothetical protein
MQRAANGRSHEKTVRELASIVSAMSADSEYRVAGSRQQHFVFTHASQQHSTVRERANGHATRQVRPRRIVRIFHEALTAPS